LQLFQRPLIGTSSIFRQSESSLLISKLPDDNDVIDSLGRIIARAAPRTMIVDTGSAFVYPVLRGMPLDGGEPNALRGPGQVGGGPVDAILRYRANESGERTDSPERQDTNGLTQVLQRDGWALWLRPNLARQVSDPDFLPVFYGFQSATGIGNIQGPLPEYRLPLFRNAYAPEAEIVVPGAPVPRVLKLEVMPYDGPQTGMVTVDGQPVALTEVGGTGPSSAAVSVSLGLRLQPCHVRLAFARGYPSPWEPQPVALRITRLQILPADR
jgi:hypothetical protein